MEKKRATSESGLGAIPKGTSGEFGESMERSIEVPADLPDLSAEIEAMSSKDSIQQIRRGLKKMIEGALMANIVPLIPTLYTAIASENSKYAIAMYVTISLGSAPATALGVMRAANGLNEIRAAIRGEHRDNPEEVV